MPVATQARFIMAWFLNALLLCSVIAHTTHAQTCGGGATESSLNGKPSGRCLCDPKGNAPACWDPSYAINYANSKCVTLQTQDPKGVVTTEGLSAFVNLRGCVCGCNRVCVWVCGRAVYALRVFGETKNTTVPKTPLQHL